MKKHFTSVLKLNLGLILNTLVISGFVVCFSVLLCARLDKAISLNFFIVLIPMWMLLLYMCVYLVLIGLASQNYKVNNAERVILSLLMPFGFLTSTVLSICYVEGYINCSLGYLYIPQAFSFICFYLFVRCLVRPSRGKIQNKP